MTEQERRRYFRINDEVAMSFSLIDGNDNGDVSVHDTLALNQEFHISLEVQIRQAMLELRAKDPKLAVMLDLLNQKMNLLRNGEHLFESSPSLKAANISACGISFSWHEKLAINQMVMLSLYLQPKHDLVRTQAHVAAVNSNPDSLDRQTEPYIIHLDFDSIHDAYQELLIQHIVQRQGSQLRKKLDEVQ
ncbi:MAG: PilZ domain-containing protein [Bermanella sp.]